MDRVERLLGHGYFPSQLPSAFTTIDLATHHAALYEAWFGLIPTPKKGAKIPKAPSSRAELFSVARAGHQRRVTSLPNPVAQTFLATQVAKHWGDFLKHYRQSKMSASRPKFPHSGERAANIPSMQPLYDRKIRMSAGYRYMLKTDVSRFFPTIYTHSVPWALHGKTVAKKNRGITPKYFGNLLDLCLRQTQDEQTFGLPIGPDTSHIIAEAIAVAVDLELKKKIKGFPAGFRYVDDYFLFFETAHAAEAALAALVRALKDFELQINFEKTKLCSVLDISDDFWSHQLRDFEISKHPTKQAFDINHFFELAKNLAKQNSDESVMMYALKKLSSIVIRKKNWVQFVAHACHIGMAYPNTLQTVARLLSTYAGVGYQLPKRQLERFVNAVIQEHAPLAHHSEVTWALWMCKDLDLTLTEANIDQISDMHSSVCALLLLDIHSTGKLKKSPKIAYWRQFENRESLYGDLWLLSYEAGLRGWGGFGDAHIVADPHFSLMHLVGIHFYEPGTKLTPFFHATPTAISDNNLNDIYELFDLEDVEDYLEYEHAEGGYQGIDFPDDDDDDDNDVGKNKKKASVSDEEDNFIDF